MGYRQHILKLHIITVIQSHCSVVQIKNKYKNVILPVCALFHITINILSFSCTPLYQKVTK
jgi:hypothetical protein